MSVVDLLTFLPCFEFLYKNKYIITIVVIVIIFIISSGSSSSIIRSSSSWCTWCIYTHAWPETCALRDRGGPAHVTERHETSWRTRRHAGRRSERRLSFLIRAGKRRAACLRPRSVGFFFSVHWLCSSSCVLSRRELRQPDVTLPPCFAHFSGAFFSSRQREVLQLKIARLQLRQVNVFRRAELYVVCCVMWFFIREHLLEKPHIDYEGTVALDREWFGNSCIIVLMAAFVHEVTV